MPGAGNGVRTARAHVELERREAQDEARAGAAHVALDATLVARKGVTPRGMARVHLVTEVANGALLDERLNRRCHTFVDDDRLYLVHEGLQIILWVGEQIGLRLVVVPFVRSEQ